MDFQLTTSEMEVLRKLQRDSAGSSDYIRYYHNKKLKEWVEGMKIRQIFLSSYSPSPNLIERLWKFLSKKVSIPASI